jgi:serine/threonine-protein kinase RsbW
LEARISDTQVIITITDEGDGFNPEEVPDPLVEQNLLKPSGRGLYLMREYADDVQYNEKGNQLKLTFKR